MSGRGSVGDVFVGDIVTGENGVGVVRVGVIGVGEVVSGGGVVDNVSSYLGIGGESLFGDAAIGGVGSFVRVSSSSVDVNTSIRRGSACV